MGGFGTQAQVTIWESLLFSARLRLPPEVSIEMASSFINDVLPLSLWATGLVLLEAIATPPRAIRHTSFTSSTKGARLLGHTSFTSPPKRGRLHGLSLHVINQKSTPSWALSSHFPFEKNLSSFACSLPYSPPRTGITCATPTSPSTLDTVDRSDGTRFLA